MSFFWALLADLQSEKELAYLSILVGSVKKWRTVCSTYIPFPLCRRRDTARTHRPLRTSETRQTFSSFSICPPLPRCHPHFCTWPWGWIELTSVTVLHVHSVPHIWSSDIRSFWFYSQCLAPNYGPKHKFIHWIFFGNMVITALWSASVWSRRGPYIWNPVYYNLREVGNSQG